MSILEKIILILAAWIILASFIAGSRLDVFATLILIGFLVLRELWGVYVDKKSKHRFDLYIYLGLIFFVVIVIKKVRDILG